MTSFDNLKDRQWPQIMIAKAPEMHLTSPPESVDLSP